MITSITLVTFVFTLCAQDILAGRTGSNLSMQQSARPQSSSSSIAIPANLGTILRSSNARLDNSPGASRPIVIHIQDAHCNYDAQVRIAQIIEHLNARYGFNVVNLEGGRGDYNLSIFTRIGKASLRKSVAEHFLKIGWIGGAEFLAATTSGLVDLWGIEDSGLYHENLDAYRSSLEHKSRVDEIISSISASLAAIKTTVYSEDLLKYDIKYGQYKAGNITFREYLSYLVAEARSRDIDISDLPNAAILGNALRQEASIDFYRAQAQRDSLIEALHKAMSKRELAELIKKTAAFGSGSLSQDHFYSYLLHAAAGFDIGPKDYADLRAYTRYIDAYNKIDALTVMKELEALDNKLREALFRTDDERQLARLSKNLALLKNFFSATITREDFDSYKSNAGSFDAATFTSFINRFGISLSLDIISQLDGYRPIMEKFYETSFLRDQVFVKNIRYSQGAAPGAIVVTGGFHSRHLEELLREEGVAYISILPNFRNPSGYICPYFDLLAGKRNPVEANIRNVLGFSLAVASVLTSMALDIYGKDSDLFREVYAQWVAASMEGKGLDIAWEYSPGGAVDAAGAVATVTPANESQFRKVALDNAQFFSRRKNLLDDAALYNRIFFTYMTETSQDQEGEGLEGVLIRARRLLRAMDPLSIKARIAASILIRGIARANDESVIASRSKELLTVLRANSSIKITMQQARILVDAAGKLYFNSAAGASALETLSDILADAMVRDDDVVPVVMTGIELTRAYGAELCLSTAIIRTFTLSEGIELTPARIDMVKRSIKLVLADSEDLNRVVGAAFLDWQHSISQGSGPAERIWVPAGDRAWEIDMADKIRLVAGRPAGNIMLSPGGAVLIDVAHATIDETPWANELKAIAVHSSDLAISFIYSDRPVNAIEMQADDALRMVTIDKRLTVFASSISIVGMLSFNSTVNSIAELYNDDFEFDEIEPYKQALYVHVARAAARDINAVYDISSILQVLRAEAKFYSIKDRVGGEANAWAIVTRQGPDGTDEWVAAAERVVTEAVSMHGYATNDAWTHVIRIGHEAFRAELAVRGTAKIGKRARVEFKSDGSLIATSASGASKTMELAYQGAIDAARLKDDVGKLMAGMQDDHKAGIEEVLSLLETYPPGIYTFDTLFEDLFGAVSPGLNRIALHHAIQGDPIALFHLALEYLVDNKLITIIKGYKAILIEITGTRRIPVKDRTLESLADEEWWDRANDCFGSGVSAREQAHYSIRILQRELFGLRDAILTERIHAIRSGESEGPTPASTIQEDNAGMPAFTKPMSGQAKDGAAARPQEYVSKIVAASKEVISETRYPDAPRYIFVPISKEICPSDRVRNQVQEMWQGVRGRAAKDGFNNVELIPYDGSIAALDEKIAGLTSRGIVISKENCLAYVSEKDLEAEADRYGKIEAMRSQGVLSVVRERIPADGAYISIGGHIMLALGIMDIVRNNRADDDYIDLVARLAAAMSDGSAGATPEAFKALLKKGDIAGIVICLPAATAHDIEKNMDEHFLAESAMIAA